MTRLLGLLLMFTLLGPGWALAGDVYVSVKGGVNAGPDAHDRHEQATYTSQTGWVTMLAVGYDFGPYRLEAEFSGRRNKADQAKRPGLALDANGDTRTQAVMVNAVYEVPAENFRATPFLLAGIGWANVTADLDEVAGQPIGYEEDDTAFAYQLGAGLEWPVGDHAAVEVSYRFLQAVNVELADNEFAVDNHAALVGLRVTF